MEPRWDDERLSESERRALATLECALDAGGRSGWRGLWGRIRFRLLVAWGARLAIWGGLAVGLAGLVVMWEELGSDIDVAVGGEGILTGGALLFAHGLRMWWYRSRPHLALRR